LLVVAKAAQHGRMTSYAWLLFLEESPAPAPLD